MFQSCIKPDQTCEKGKDVQRVRQTQGVRHCSLPEILCRYRYSCEKEGEARAAQGSGCLGDQPQGVLRDNAAHYKNSAAVVAVKERKRLKYTYELAAPSHLLCFHFVGCIYILFVKNGQFPDELVKISHKILEGEQIHYVSSQTY
jgi:hypothetical protein